MQKKMMKTQFHLIMSFVIWAIYGNLARSCGDGIMFSQSLLDDFDTNEALRHGLPAKACVSARVSMGAAQ